MLKEVFIVELLGILHQWEILILMLLLGASFTI